MNYTTRPWYSCRAWLSFDATIMLIIAILLTTVLSMLIDVVLFASSFEVNLMICSASLLDLLQFLGVCISCAVRCRLVVS